MIADSPARSWWLDPLPQEASSADSAITGLARAEAKMRLAKFGPNLFRNHEEVAPWRQFFARFKNSLVILLLVASAISAMTGELTSFFIISVMVLFSGTLNFIQEHRADNAATSLRQALSNEIRAG